MNEVRIGVFVCHCGTNIGGFVDVPGVIEYVKKLPGVVYAEQDLYTCADDGLTAIKTVITDHQLNRIVVAACTSENPCTSLQICLQGCRTQSVSL